MLFLAQELLWPLRHTGEKEDRCVDPLFTDEKTEISRDLAKFDDCKKEADKTTGSSNWEKVLEILEENPLSLQRKV